MPFLMELFSALSFIFFGLSLFVIRSDIQIIISIQLFIAGFVFAGLGRLLNDVRDIRNSLMRGPTEERASSGVTGAAMRSSANIPPPIPHQHQRPRIGPKAPLTRG